MHYRVTDITSLGNQRIKDIIRLNKRSERDEQNVIIIEGYRELKRALDNGWPIRELFFSPSLYKGENEPALVQRCSENGAALFQCSREAFLKMAYKDGPEGLLALAPQVRKGLADLNLPANPLLIVAESIEKPGNLGSLLRSADAAGVNAVIVCDKCTDINNPNVVRSSIGTLFSIPVVEASSQEALDWLKARAIKILAATPHTDKEYTDVDMRGGVAIVVGTEKVGLSDLWMKQSDLPVRIPMLGQADSLNVSCATTILLYEAVRQRRLNPKAEVETANFANSR